MTAKTKPVLMQRKYLLLFLGTSILSFTIFMSVTLLFSWSQFLFFNYFLKDAVSVMISTFIIMAAFSIGFGILTVFVAHRFRAVIGKRLYGFFAVSMGLYIISYILMLATTSFSLFLYVQTSGLLYATISLLLLVPILSLSSFLIINTYAIIKNIKSGVSGAGGLTISFFSLGCPSCGALLLSLIGVTAGLTIFPLQGLELKIFSIALLIFATYKLTNSRTCTMRSAEPNVNSKATHTRGHSK